jgi:cysteine-rich repeat protein
MACLTSRLAGVLFLSLAACGSVTDDESTTDNPTGDNPTPDAGTPDVPTGPAFRFFTADAGGAPKNAFDVLDDAHLTAGGLLDVAPGDYYFSVTYEVCRPGLAHDQYFPQQSPVACRAFTIGANGRITTGAAVTEVDGVACPHVATSTPNGLAIGLTPFELHPATCGVFLARVIPAGQPEIGINAVANLFFTAPFDGGEVLPVCGDGHVDDGEQCDDGNENDDDGCSALGQIEPDCQT